MAAWTSKIWNETVHMLEHGTSQCNMGRSTMHVNCTGDLPQHVAQLETVKRNPGRSYPIRNGGWNTSHVVTTRKGRGVTFSPGDDMREIIDRYLHHQDEVHATEHSYSQIGRFAYIFIVFLPSSAEVRLTIWRRAYITIQEFAVIFLCLSRSVYIFHK